VPVLMDDDVSTFRMFWALMGAGIYTNPVVVPAASTNLLRISCMATHTIEHVDRLVAAMTKLANTAGSAVN
jgi:8-amino-7-oxononanoate synthase